MGLERTPIGIVNFPLFCICYGLKSFFFFLLNFFNLSSNSSSWGLEQVALTSLFIFDIVVLFSEWYLPFRGIMASVPGVAVKSE